MRDAFTSTRTLSDLPRLPLKGSIDLTYRCNNRCRHCWLWTDKGEGELTKEEIFDIVDQARAMGCREWAISGGEPMLRPDFAEIFDYITSRSRTYSLNTNGTLITPEIAQLMKRKGSKMVALYGATAEVHDHITRNPGSFDATMRGFELLKEAGAGFVVQIVPMKDNYHQFEEMKALAESLSPHWRIGASWLFLSASRDPAQNAGIVAQRLPPDVVVELDPPSSGDVDDGRQGCPVGDDRLFAACIEARREFHVDPYGMLSFCPFVKDPVLRYDLRAGTFREGWEEFVPSVAERVLGGGEYREGCDSCPDRGDCQWCPVYGYLEHGRHSAPVEYLCKATQERRLLMERLMRTQRQYYEIGGITVQVDSDLPFTDTTFGPAIDQFRVPEAGTDVVKIQHHFELPRIDVNELGLEVYRRPPWVIYRRGESWVYLHGGPDRTGGVEVNKVAVFSADHSAATIYHSGPEPFMKGSLHALTTFPTDQILIARLLADRDGFILHAAGAIMDGRGLVFVGHSEAGKTTISNLIAPHAEILCDDRVIVRRCDDGWRVHGTWSHGDLATVSPSSAPLHGVLFLEKADQNCITRIEDRRDIVRRLLSCVIRPLATGDWWEKTLYAVEAFSRDAPCYLMQSDRSGEILAELDRL